MRVIYATAADVTAPNGPGVNEREFLLAAIDAGILRVANVPEPARALGELGGHDEIVITEPSAGGPMGIMLVNQIGMLRGLTRQIEEAKADGVAPIVVVRLPWLPWSLVRLQRRFPDVPLFLKSVGLVHDLPEYRGLKHKISRALLPLHERLVRKVLRQSSGLDAPTPQLAAFLTDRYDLAPGQAVCIANATNTDRFDPQRFDSADTSATRRIGYIGGHPFERGGREVLRALARLRTRFPDLRGLIVGGDVDKLSNEAAELGVSDICEIPGQLPYEEVSAQFARLDFLLATDRPERAGTFGNSNQKIRQALAMRVPVITNPDCEPLLLHEGVVRGIDTSDSDLVEREVERLLSLPESEMEVLRNRCRKVAVDHFSTRATLQQRLAFWQQRISAG